MSTLSPDQWQALSPYLDQALAMTNDERAAWLSTLGGRNPALAAQLAALLEEHRVLVEEGYLERGSSMLRGPGLTGQPIGPYKLISQIGQGGMGSVWLAERSDGRFERQVAVKFLSVALAGRAGEERRGVPVVPDAHHRDVEAPRPERRPKDVLVVARRGVEVRRFPDHPVH